MLWELFAFDVQRKQKVYVDIAHEPLPCYSCYFHAMPSPVAFVQTKRLEDWSHLCIFLQHTMHTTHTHTNTWHDTHTYDGAQWPIISFMFSCFFFLYLFEDKKYIFTNICVSRLNESSIIPLTQRWCSTAHCGRTNRIQHRLSTIFFTVSSVTANDWLMWYFRHICIYLRLSRHSLH